MVKATRNLLALTALLAAGTAVAAGERVLFDNPDYAVTTADDNRYCEQPMTVTIETGNPDLLESRSALQRIVDGTHAVLAYECPEMRTVTVHGRLEGIREPVVKAVARKESNWQLDTRKSFESRDEDEDWQRDRERPAERPAQPAFNVARLETGMSLDEARSTVANTFDVQPSYDVQKGLLDMQAGGCPRDYDWSTLSPLPEPGWKCLRAWFTDQRQERLYLVELIQVVEGEKVDEIEAFLTDQFGQPVQRRADNQQEEWWQDEPPQYMLAWGEVVETAPAPSDGGQTERHTLQARITPVEDVTILSVALYEPGLRPERSVQQHAPALDLDL